MSDEHASEIIEAAEASTEIVDALNSVADAGEKLLASGLTRRAICVLIRDKTGLGMGDINAVIDALPGLRAYVQKETQK